mgnify:CR=1 FL=1
MNNGPSLATQSAMLRRDALLRSILDVRRALLSVRESWERLFYLQDLGLANGAIMCGSDMLEALEQVMHTSRRYSAQLETLLSEVRSSR